MADRVTVRSPEGEAREVGEAAVPFFVNQGYVVLDKAGRTNTKATNAATTSKEH